MQKISLINNGYKYGKWKLKYIYTQNNKTITDEIDWQNLIPKIITINQNFSKESKTILHQINLYLECDDAIYKYTFIWIYGHQTNIWEINLKKGHDGKPKIKFNNNLPYKTKEGGCYTT